ncbi:UDP-2,4-diacetamido-2,4,6-trideoxy-beta-L-altropyranose hydrolase [Gottfriedia sp. NPDC056225]|uniref:UDP-2,4-diacetamido-2,4, 6-trideoxy-beta-L-altropyranose hydrolase n=1 Tax=Gottfriedia sp. NPDC056225 TaxID=3345751 RepID=UPI0035E18827
MNSKSIYFRVDASYEIGTGHVMRCLTLANLFSKYGINIVFICRDLQGNLNYLIEEHGYKLCTLPSGASNQDFPQKLENPYEAWLSVDWKTDVLQTVNVMNNNPSKSCFIIDHYSIDSKWEELFYQLVRKEIIVIDDLANRNHFCHILLDQNLSNNSERYQDLVPANCVKFIGTPYVILRKEFMDEKINIRNRNGNIKRILVFFGGSDPTNETLKTLNVLIKSIYSHIHIDIVVGNSNKNKEAIKLLCKDKANIHFHCQISHMAKLMNLADLSIGAGGTTTWERCYLGLPTLTIATADNQVDIINLVNETGSIYHLGKSTLVTSELIEKKLNLLMENPLNVLKMSQNAYKLMGENRLNSFIEKVVECLNDTN